MPLCQGQIGWTRARQGLPSMCRQGQKLAGREGTQKTKTTKDPLYFKTPSLAIAVQEVQGPRLVGLSALRQVLHPTESSIGTMVFLVHLKSIWFWGLEGQLSGSGYTQLSSPPTPSCSQSPVIPTPPTFMGTALKCIYLYTDVYTGIHIS